MPAPDPPRLSPLLSRCSVFVDFDGTVSAEDVGIGLLERFVPGHWEAIDARYERGDLGSQQYVSELWRALEDVDRAELRAAAEEVPLDSGFPCLVAFLQTAGAEVAVVSDGLGFYVATRCRPYGVPVLANGVAGRVPQFPFADATCPCGLCGTCKAGPVRRARDRGRTTIVIGDGTSDRFGAAVADVVFAKGRLADWCRHMEATYLPFTGLADVEQTLRAATGQV